MVPTGAVQEGLKSAKARDTGEKVRCPSCGTMVPLLLSKSDRFLFLCLDCGLQCFSRGNRCNQWFAKLVKEA
jgi:predicted RNA-binding Zn-ribbon protein involved in translation (DUF1610 family)